MDFPERFQERRRLHHRFRPGFIYKLYGFAYIESLFAGRFHLSRWCARRPTALETHEPKGFRRFRHHPPRSPRGPGAGRREPSRELQVPYGTGAVRLNDGTGKAAESANWHTIKDGSSTTRGAPRGRRPHGETEAGADEATTNQAN
jgi:hypothetical protein